MKPNYFMYVALGLTIAQSGPALARDNDRVVYARSVDRIERTEMPDGDRTVRVNFADLDLAQPVGETVLRKRISIAVTYVCEGPPPDGHIMLGSSDSSVMCVRETRKAMQPRIDAVIAAARSGKKLAFTSFGMVSR